MNLITPILITTFLYLLSTIDWIVGLPVTDGGNGHNASEPSQDQPISDQAFPFKDYQNESKSFLVVDDMIVKMDPSRAGMVNAAWPNGIIPYTFQYTVNAQQRQQIMQAMNELSAVTCIKFRPAERTDTYNIEFRSDPMNQGCSSFVGWQNRKNQPIQLAPICSKGNAIHEIMHAMGFFHEQTRDDRDTYVVINFNNIQPGFENNFKKDSELYTDSPTSYFGVPYNFESIMHYGKTYFSKNGQNTIDVLNTDGALGNSTQMGQREYISEGDVQMMRQKYMCGESEVGGQEEMPTTSSKPTTNPSNPICQLQPHLPTCKQATN